MAVRSRPATARGLTRSSAVLLVGATIVLSAGNSVVFPLLADLQDAFGLPTWGLGLLSGASFLAGLVAQIVMAPQADRGRARLLLIIGLVLTLGALGWFVVGTELWHFVAARGLEGLALGCFLPAARSVVIRADPEHVGQNLGRLSAAELGGFLLGPLVGAVLADQIGLDAPFIALGAAVALALVALLVLPLDTGGVGGATSAGPLAAFELLRHRAVVAAALIALALTLPVGVYDALWARYLDDRGASTLFIGASLALYGVPYVLLAPAGGRLADRFGPVRVAVRVIVMIAPMIVLYGLFRSPWLIMAVSIVEGAVQAAAVPAMQSAMAEATPPERVAAGQGLAGAVGLAGAGVAALGAAPLYGLAGPEVVFVLAGAVTLALGVAIVRLRAPGQR